uniref:Predicted nucleic acid-binding protein, contains PIN domain n=1 Tax=Candidatus Kentrum sp. LPFa TaxID=2126335 RepID=A0A450WTY8_9GAMM|nr:MAG: Predicted nucleic acid-binding protein, contains PIN domain [Candidatus Kentron sp. LPFa]
MKTVYIESSVISYLTARPSRDVVTAAKQAITLEWWEEHGTQYEIFLSELVLEEVSFGDSSAAQKRLRIIENIPILETTGNAVELSRILVAEKAIPETSMEDALHIAIAAVQGMDFLLTWGFTISCATFSRSIIFSWLWAGNDQAFYRKKLRTGQAHQQREHERKDCQNNHGLAFQESGPMLPGGTCS